MSLRRPTPVVLPLIALILSVVISACVAPSAREEAERTLRSAPPPSFPPLASPTPGDPTTPEPDPADEADPVTTGDPPAATGTDEHGAAPEGPTETAPPAPPSPTTVVITDPRGDVAHPPLRDPPDYVDLIEIQLTMFADEMVMDVTVADDIPHRQQRDDRTMNVALFMDVTGDGAIDHEVWANLADDGWFPAHRDNRAREARFGAETGITVTPSGRTLRFEVPADLVGTPTSFRWVVATEWGDYVELGTDLAARDRAPDDDPASFP